MSQVVAAAGMKPHTGWVATVVVLSKSGGLSVVARERTELLPPDGSISKHLYHDASERSDAAAQALIDRAWAASQALAKAFLARLITTLNDRDLPLVACAVLTSKHQPLDAPLSTILRSHPRIHAAEGKFFQDVLVEACVANGIAAIRIPEHEVWTAAANASHRKVTSLQNEVERLGKPLGPPWTADQKNAAAAATAALAVRQLTTA